MTRRFKSTAIICIVLMIFTTAAYADPSESEKTVKSTPPRDSPIQNIFDQTSSKVEIQADSLEYVKGESKIIAKGNVSLSYQETQLNSDYAELETDTKKAFARGHAVVYQNGTATAHGEEVHYDFNNRSATFGDGRLYSFPWFTSGTDVSQPKQNVKVIKGGTLTSCNLERPHYLIRSKKITVYEGDKMIARNVTIYALGRPIFWVPFMMIPLQRTNFPLAVNTGYNSKYGYFIEVSKGFSVLKQLWGKWHTDWRSKRGFGAGVSFSYDYGRKARGTLDLYLTQDKRAPTPGSANPYSELERRERGRITYRHRTDFDPDTHLILRYNRLADEYFLQDFFEKEFKSEIEPQSFVTLTKNTEHFGLLAHMQKRMNRFEALVERLPHLQLDVKNQPLLAPWIFYEGQTSFSNLHKRHGRFIPFEEDVIRSDAFNELSAPLRWRDIKFTPYANVRGTLYSREATSSDTRYRTVFGWGSDLRTHFYKVYNFSFDKFGVEANQLRHVIEPNVQYKSLRTSIDDERFTQFDSIDKLDQSDIFTFGIENRIQTKRVVNGRMQRVDLVSMNTFLSYEIHPDFHSNAGLFAPITDGRTRSNFTLLSQEVVLRPYNWLQYEARTDYDVEFDYFRVFNQDFKLQVGRYDLIFGHRYIRDISDEIEGSNQFVFEGAYRINDLWKTGGYIRWDASDQALEEWQLSAERDLHDFIFRFGYNVRNSTINNNNKTLFFDFRLKAFPMLHLSGGNNQASFSSPRIGDTVAGSNAYASTAITDPFS